MVLVLKRLRRRGNGLKSHPTDWEKPGIVPAIPGLQDIGLRKLIFHILRLDNLLVSSNEYIICYMHFNFKPVRLRFSIEYRLNLKQC